MQHEFLSSDEESVSAKEIILLHIVESSVLRHWKEKLIKSDMDFLDSWDEYVLLASFYQVGSDEQLSTTFPGDRPGNTYDVFQSKVRAMLRLCENYLPSLNIWQRREPRLADQYREIQAFAQAGKNFLLSRSDIDLSYEGFLRQLESRFFRQIIETYISAQAEKLAQNSEDLASVSALSKLTGYSEPHLRALIRNGEIVGCDTARGWYGSVESIHRYGRSAEAEQQKPGAPRGHR